MKQLSIAAALLSLSIAAPVFACPGADHDAPATKQTAKAPEKAQDAKDAKDAKPADKAKAAEKAQDAKDAKPAKPADKVSQK